MEYELVIMTCVQQMQYFYYELFCIDSLYLIFNKFCVSHGI